MSDSFEQWAAARAASLIRFAYLVTGSQHAAEDAVQSALEAACAKWSRVRRTEDPDQYVRRMVVNAHISAWRRSGQRELAVAEPRHAADAEGSDVESAAVRRNVVWETCRALPAQQRAAVVLRYYEDLDYDEIARVLGVTSSTARAHVHRGLAAMRATLTESPSQEA